MRRKQEREDRLKRKAEKRQQKATQSAIIEISTVSSTPPVAGPVSKPPPGPIAFVFPGQGSQAVGMLKVDHRM